MGKLLDMGVINTNSMQMELGAGAGLLIRLIFYTNFNSSATHPRLRRQKQEFSSCGRIRHHFLLTRGLITSEPHLQSIQIDRKGFLLSIFGCYIVLVGLNASVVICQFFLRFTFCVKMDRSFLSHLFHPSSGPSRRFLAIELEIPSTVLLSP